MELEQPAPTASPKKGRKTATVHPVEGLFKLLLALPHEEHETSFEMYRDWLREHLEQSNNSSAYDEMVWMLKTEGGYDQAVGQWTACEPFERKLESDVSLLVFVEYLNFLKEDTSMHPMMQGVVERCLNLHSLDPAAWRYIFTLVVRSSDSKEI